MNKTPSFKAALSFPNRAIAALFSQIEQQKQILQYIHAMLPEEIAKHVLHCVVKDKKLLIYTDAAAWASQLRFYNKAILAAIAPITRESVSLMQVKIQPETANEGKRTAPGREPNIPSEEKIKLIHEHSLAMSDKQLQNALQRLSATLEKLSRGRRSQPD